MGLKVDLTDTCSTEPSVPIAAIDNLLVVAPAGTGKTTLLAEESRKSERPTVLTFTVYARKKLQEKGVRASTIHSLCWHLLGEPGVLDRANQVRLMTQAMASVGIKVNFVEAKRYCELYDKTRVKRIEATEEAFKTYESLKEGRKDFTDLLLEGLVEIRRKQLSYFADVYVDEFQDLSWLQYDILKALNARSLKVFADPYQSIYEWRDAYPEIIDLFKKEFSPQEVCLKENHRSSRSIVKLLEFLHPTGMYSNLDGGQVIQVLCPSVDFQYDKVRSILREVGEATILARYWKDLLPYEGLSGAYLMLDSENEVQYRGFGNLSRRGAVALSTIHTYKGLEADNVIVLNCSNGTMPPQRWVEEENRVFYVACSRAGRNLFLLSPNSPTVFLDGAPVEVRDEW